MKLCKIPGQMGDSRYILKTGKLDFYCGLKGHIKSKGTSRVSAAHGRGSSQLGIKTKTLTTLITIITLQPPRLQLLLVDSHTLLLMKWCVNWKSTETRHGAQSIAALQHQLSVRSSSSPFMGGSLTDVLGTVQTKINMGKFATTFPLQILNKTKYEVIIGRDLTEEFVDSICVREKQMILINYKHKAACTAYWVDQWCAKGW